MQISEKIKEKEFEAKTTKEAYLKCCKWVASNVIAVNNCNNVTYKIEKVQSKTFGIGKVKLTLYATTDEQELYERNCAICEEVNGLFFLNQQKHRCEACKIIPYRERIKQKIKLVKEGLKI